MALPDYTAMGFTLDVHAVRKQLRLPRVGEVYDLVRKGEVSALNTQDPGTRERELLFHPDEITDYIRRQATAAQVVEERLINSAFEILNDYLMALDPVEDYDEAVQAGRPLLGAGREGESPVFVQTAAIREWFNSSDEVQMGARTSVVTAPLEVMLSQIGAIRARGILARADRGTKKQRWAYWWRLPERLFTDALPDPAPSGLRVGERVAQSGGHVHLAETLTSRSSDG